MRFVIVGPVYPFRGGIAHFTGCLSGALEEEGHRTLLVNFRNQYPTFFFPGKSQFEKNSFFDKIVSSRILTPYNPFTFRKTLKEILSFQPDLVMFSFFLPIFAPAYSYLIRRLEAKGLKTMVLAHNIEFHEKWLFGKRLTASLLKSTSFVMTLSQEVASRAVEHLKGFPVRIIKGFHPIYGFHNRNRYSPKEAREVLGLEEKRVILFFGYIKQYKGVDLLIKSFPLLRKKIGNAVLLIVGEIYGNKQYYLELIKNTGFEREIILKDEYVSDDDVELYFKSADVLVLPYRQATQSGVIQTAQVMNLGAVVTPVGGLPEMIIPDKTGVIASSVSETAIAEALEKYFSLNRSDVKKSIEQICSDFSWQNFVRLMVDSL